MVPVGDLPDSAIREQALTPGESFIVEAPAGSGKTELLVRRHLTLLALVESPEEIVAITFTNKAASEMRTRILEAIAAPEETGGALATLAAAVRVAATRQGWDLSLLSGRLRIQTIDAFASSLVRRMPYLSRAGAMPVMADEPERFYEMAARAVLARLESDPSLAPALETVLSHLDNDVPRVERLLGTLLSRRDQWMRHLASPVPSRELFETAYRSLTEERLAEMTELLPETLATQWLAAARFAANHVGPESKHAGLCVFKDAIEMPARTCEGLPKWRVLCDLVLTAAGGWRRSVTVAQGFPPRERMTGEQRHEAEAAKADFAALSHALEAHDALRDWARDVRALPDPAFDEEEWAVMEALWRVLREAVAELWVVFQARGIADFTQIAWAAAAALGPEDEPTPLAEVLDYRIQHLLIDEFQDTSVSQFELLARLIQAWVPGDGHSLFLVGDPMQSIYRFRQADVGLFVRVQRDGIAGIRPRPLRLTANFRSEAGLVEWTNDAFARIFPNAPDMELGAVTFGPAHAVRPAVAVTPVTIEAADPGVDEAGRVLARVQDALAAGAWPVAVLVRARTHIGVIARALRDAEVHFQAVAIESLAARPVVRDLESLTRALLHRGDRLSWLALLRSPVCGLLLDELSLFVPETPWESVWDRLTRDDLCARLGEDARGRVARVVRVLDIGLARAGRVDVRTLVEDVWLALSGPATVARDADLVDAGVFFDLLSVHGQGGILADLERFSRALTRLYASPDLSPDSHHVQLMTIHQAKGLEFATVILPGLGRKPRSETGALLAWAERVRPGSPTDLLVAPIGATEHKTPGRASPGGKGAYLTLVERQKSTRELARLGYVAVTRARDRLHLIGPALEGRGEPASQSLLSALWPMLGPHWPTTERALPVVSSTESGRAQATCLRWLPGDWVAPAFASPVVSVPEPPAREGQTVREFQWAGEVIRQVGVVAHRVLALVAPQGLGGPIATSEDTRARLLAALLKGAGIPRDQFEEALVRAQAAVAGALSDRRGRWILDAGHIDARSEWRLTGRLDGTLVSVALDRSFIADGVRWIIDFKTGTHEGSDVDGFLDREQLRYRDQLERYARLVTLLDARPIRLGLYFPLLRGWREWGWEPDTPGV